MLVFSTLRLITFLIIATTIPILSLIIDVDDYVDGVDLVVGISPDYSPFAFTKDSVIVGFDVDLINKIAEITNKKIIIKEIEFSSLIPSLYSKKVDLIISGISRNAHRNNNIDFSNSYYINTFAIIVQSDKKFIFLEDLPNNARIGVQTGSTMENFINNYNHIINSTLEIVSLGSNSILLEKLRLREIDALIIEEIQALTLVKKTLGLRSSTVSNNTYVKMYQEHYSIGLLKYSNFTQVVNKAIKELHNNQSINLLLKKWNLLHF